MASRHEYVPTIVWTGNRGDGTRNAGGYDRNWNIETPGRPTIACSNDPLLGGDPALPNPEDLLIASLSSCHMLWYLHLAQRAGIVVQHYTDSPVGIGESEPNGVGRFVKAVLKPTITVEVGSDLERADAIHHRIHKYCFIARSVAFPVEYEATYREA